MRRALLALAAGVAVGAAGAAVRADEPSTARRAPLATPTPTPIGVRVSSQQIVARAADPGGGPEWAVKRIESIRLKDGRRVGKPQTCVQLGRVRDGVFGWFGGDGAFRRLGPEDLPQQCMPATWKRPTGQFVSTVSLADPAAPRITAAVAWGRFPRASKVTVSGTEGADGEIATADGAFLRVFPASARPRAGATIRGAGRNVPLGPGRIPARVRSSYPHVIPGTERVEARTPDPFGGPGFGVLVADTREGVPCFAGAAQVVGDRTGWIDLGLGLFGDVIAYDSLCRPLSERLTRARPCTEGSYGGAGGPGVQDRFRLRAQVERRLQAGRTVFWAVCRPDVERVTLRSPRDIRTLVPSATAHAVLAVYDGMFVDGRVELIPQLKP